jgi:hypothetical protein
MFGRSFSYAIIFLRSPLLSEEYRKGLYKEIYEEKGFKEKQLHMIQGLKNRMNI